MHTDYGTSSISQAVCTELLKSGEYENHLINLRHVLKERRDFFGNLLTKYLSKYGEFSLPEGGFFIWFTFYSDLNIPLKELFRLCIQDQVLINLVLSMVIKRIIQLDFHSFLKGKRI